MTRIVVEIKDSVNSRELDIIIKNLQLLIKNSDVAIRLSDSVVEMYTR